jgi:hypothetical protein
MIGKITASFEADISAIYNLIDFAAGIAQLVRAPDCGSGGRGFETHYPPSSSSTKSNI